MQNVMRKWPLLIIIASTIVLLASLSLHVHNALLYEPSHGFDGAGHVYYAQYIAKHLTLPDTNQWETHQPPLYYVIGALVIRATGMNFKALQLTNIAVFFLLVLIAYLGFRKVFGKQQAPILLGTFSLLALPMLNIFPPMVTNELLNAFFISAVIISSIYLAYAKKLREFIYHSILALAFLTLGFYTKISIFTAIPAYTVAVIIQLFRKQKTFSTTKLILTSVIGILLLVAIVYPIFRRIPNQGPSNIASYAKAPPIQKPYFFYRIDWLLKVDMFNAQYYSFLGGSWNSFWQDGHNAITPFVSFHKKVLVLWSLGFILFPISLYGLVRLWKYHRKAAIVIGTYAITALSIYVLFNIKTNHYSAVRLTYIMPIALVYAFGIAGAASNKKLKWILLVLLFVQYSVMVSHFWIQPWWHVTR